MTLCAGCNKEIQVGDRFIADTVSGFLQTEDENGVDEIISGIFGAPDGLVWFCEECTEPGGDYKWQTYLGSENRV